MFVDSAIWVSLIIVLLGFLSHNNSPYFALGKQLQLLAISLFSYTVGVPCSVLLAFSFGYGNSGLVAGLAIGAFIRFTLTTINFYFIDLNKCVLET